MAFLETAWLAVRLGGRYLGRGVGALFLVFRVVVLIWVGVVVVYACGFSPLAE